MAISRRPFLTEPGEPLLVARDPFDSAIRFGVLNEASNLPAERLFVSTMLTVPLPLPAEGADTVRDRWPEVPAYLLWHPLFWLPDHIQHRYRIDDDLETDDVWAVRVAMELTSAGLYDTDTGTWLDVLDYACGLNVDNEADEERVSAWLMGGEDPELDSVADQVEALFHDDVDEDWAINAAMSMVDQLSVMSWALQSDSLIEMCDDVTSAVEGGDKEAPSPDEALTLAQMIGAFGHAALSNISVEEAEFWKTVDGEIRAIGDNLNALSAGPLSKIIDHLLAVRDQYWPVLEAASADAETVVNAGTES